VPSVVKCKDKSAGSMQSTEERRRFRVFGLLFGEEPVGFCDVRERNRLHSCQQLQALTDPSRVAKCRCCSKWFCCCWETEEGKADFLSSFGSLVSQDQR
jgi:hypothetical protein